MFEDLKREEEMDKMMESFNKQSKKGSGRHHDHHMDFMMHRMMMPFDFHHFHRGIKIESIEPDFERYTLLQERTMQAFQFLEDNVACRYNNIGKAEYICCQEECRNHAVMCGNYECKCNK